ncbi:hypothetical protein LXL04_007758 [Taraxacum kok-saghyz]
MGRLFQADRWLELLFLAAVHRLDFGSGNGIPPGGAEIEFGVSGIADYDYFFKLGSVICYKTGGFVDDCSDVWWRMLLHMLVCTWDGGSGPRLPSVGGAGRGNIGNEPNISPQYIKI